MKRVTVVAGQGSKNYGERLTYRQVSKALEHKAMEIIFPSTFSETIKCVARSNGVILAGRRAQDTVDILDVLNVALELEKPVFLFGVELGEMREKGLKRFSTSLMSSLVSGFLTDVMSVRWANFWSKNKIKVGADLAHVYLLNHVKHGKSKYAVFAPNVRGVLRNYKEYKWLPKVDVRMIVANPADSGVAVEVSRRVRTDEIVILSDVNDVMEAVANAKFVISERFHVSLTALSFGIPFIHIGRRAMRYFGKAFIENFSVPEEVDIALAFSRLGNRSSNFLNFNEGIKSRYESMLNELEKFLLSI